MTMAFRVKNCYGFVVRSILGIMLLSLPVLVLGDPNIDLIRVLKSEHKLQALSSDKVLYEFNVALGKNPQGHKLKEGDGKTPEGNYLLDHKNDRSSFYKAFHISYPNSIDIATAKASGVEPGGQIMVHGQKNGFAWLSLITQRFDWTNGCIALDNSDMDTLWAVVKEGTRIEIRP
jgi:murein L,D-transpeptidase YafK